MNVRVKLPPGDLIEYGELCKAIAQAVAPADEQPLEGMACIVGKLVRYQIPMPSLLGNGAASMASFQSVLVTADGCALEKLQESYHGRADVSGTQIPLLEPAYSAVAEVKFPMHLSDEDRCYLVKVLPKLPMLRYPMSEEEESAFMKAYLALEDKPSWMPRLVSSATIEELKALQYVVMSKHRQALRKEFALGRLNAVDRSYVGVSELSIGCYFPRTQAIAYLRWNGMNHDDEDLNEVPAVIAKKPLEETVVLSDDAASSRMQRKLDDKKRQKIREIYNDLKRNRVKNYTKKTAEMFGISDRYVRKLIQEPSNPFVPRPK